MKNLTLINNAWMERVNPQITDEEKLALINNDLPDAEIKQIIENINARTYFVASQEDTEQAQSIYDTNKLEGAELISIDITLPDGCGIINCRLDGKHKQIRF
jgi:hypothetical protein